MVIPKETDCIVNLSGGFECLAALWYAKQKGWNPVGLALYNPMKKKNFADKELLAAKNQAAYFEIPLVVSESTIPQENDINNYPVLQHQSAVAQLIQGNRQINFKYIIWGANADDSFRQRLQLRYPFRAMMAGRSRTLDLHGVKPHHILSCPVNIFPFEWMTKSEMIAMILQSNRGLINLIWTCSSDLEEPCGTCTKCMEWKYNYHLAQKSILKQGEANLRYD